MSLDFLFLLNKTVLAVLGLHAYTAEETLCLPTGPPAPLGNVTGPCHWAHCIHVCYPDQAALWFGKPAGGQEGLLSPDIQREGP